ncbi:hypothetical protein [Actinoplanes sp. G11-F43]|uniref:hypothetical protein n=1 Tax=Actinoplanes sp. G11-F43 TaxID=3424130 RepID=UPI003D336482
MVNPPRFRPGRDWEVPGRYWEVRFTEAPGPTELGPMVVFHGIEVAEIDDMSEWDHHPWMW